MLCSIWVSLPVTYLLATCCQWLVMLRIPLKRSVDCYAKWCAWHLQCRPSNLGKGDAFDGNVRGPWKTTVAVKTMASQKVIMYNSSDNVHDLISFSCVVTMKSGYAAVHISICILILSWCPPFWLSCATKRQGTRITGPRTLLWSSWTNGRLNRENKFCCSVSRCLYNIWSELLVVQFNLCHPHKITRIWDIPGNYVSRYNPIASTHRTPYNIIFTWPLHNFSYYTSFNPAIIELVPRKLSCSRTVCNYWSPSAPRHTCNILPFSNDGQMRLYYRNHLCVLSGELYPLGVTLGVTLTYCDRDKGFNFFAENIFKSVC